MKAIWYHWIDEYRLVKKGRYFYAVLDRQDIPGLAKEGDDGK